jgi:hypothetical protein
LDLWLNISQVMSRRQSNLNTLANQTAFEEWLFRGVCLVKLQVNDSGIQKRTILMIVPLQISIIWLYADNHPVHKQSSWLEIMECHLNCNSLLSSANYVLAISTHINIHSFAHSFWAIQLYNLQVMCHTR